MYVKHKKNHLYAREKVYAVYKGEEFKITGTWYDVLEYLGISENTLRYYLSPSYKKRFKKGDARRLVVIDLEEEIELNGRKRKQQILK